MVLQAFESRPHLLYGRYHRVADCCCPCARGVADLRDALDLASDRSQIAFEACAVCSALADGSPARKQQLHYASKSEAKHIRAQGRPPPCDRPDLPQELCS